MGDSADEDEEEELSQEMMLGFTQASQMPQATPNKVKIFNLSIVLAKLTRLYIAADQGPQESKSLEAMGPP